MVAPVDTFNVTADTSANLNAGTGAIADVFTIAAGVTLTGALDGQGGADSLTLGDAGASARLTGADGDGYAGDMTTGLTGTFDGIRTLTGGGSGTLTGEGANSTWTLGAVTTYDDLGGNGVLTFDGFGTLQGGNMTDTFNVKAQDLASTLTLKGGDPTDDVF